MNKKYEHTDLISVRAEAACTELMDDTCFGLLSGCRAWTMAKTCQQENYLHSISGVSAPPIQPVGEPADITCPSANWLS